MSKPPLGSLPLGLGFHVAPYIILSGILLGSSCSNVFRSLTRFALIKVASFCRSTCSLLDVAAFIGRDDPVVSCARYMAAVLGGAAGEFVGDALVNAGLGGCRYWLVGIRWCTVGKHNILLTLPPLTVFPPKPLPSAAALAWLLLRSFSACLAMSSRS